MIIKQYKQIDTPVSCKLPIIYITSYYTRYKIIIVNNVYYNNNLKSTSWFFCVKYFQNINLNNDKISIESKAWHYNVYSIK